MPEYSASRPKHPSGRIIKIVDSLLIRGGFPLDMLSTDRTTNRAEGVDVRKRVIEL